MRTKVVLVLTPTRAKPVEMELVEVGRFVLRDDGTVSATYVDEADRDWLGHIKARGIRGTVTADSGAVFFEALDDAFGNASRVVVRELGEIDR